MTMSNPDQIRADIERTRGNLSSDVNALTDTVNPRNVARRQVGKARGAVTGVRHKVMGVADSAAAGTSSAASGISGSVAATPQLVTDQTRGNPLAAGIIALGAGWLLGSMLPATSKEAALASTAKHNASTLAQPLTDAAKSVATELKQPAQEAAEAVKSTATDAAQTVKDESTSAATDMKSQAQQAKGAVQDAHA